MGPPIIVDSVFGHLTGDEKVRKLNELIEEWREPQLVQVLPELVIPDTTNRSNTGLSENHVHYIADRMQRMGFTPRNLVTGEGHDLPILVRESVDSELGTESLHKWRSFVAKRAHMPRTRLGAPGPDGDVQDDFFCSLGNGHFFQALNLFGTTAHCKFPEITGQRRYWTSFDAKLHSAVKVHGVPCVVLRSGMSKQDRKFVSEMLNSTFEFRWVLENPQQSSRVMLDITKGVFREFETFDALAKHADAYELDEVVESKMRFEKRDRSFL